MRFIKLIVNSRGAYMSVQLGKNYILRLVWGILFLVQAIVATAQPGEERYKAFVVEVIDAKSKQAVEHLQLTICDQNGNAIKQWIELVPGNGRKHINTLIGFQDSFVFWQNSHPPVSRVKPTTDFFKRKSFRGLQNQWVCVVPSFSGGIDLYAQSITIDAENKVKHLSSTLTMPVFVRIRLHDPKGRYPDALLAIPKHRTYDINQLTYQNKSIEPIQIMVSPNKSPEVINETYRTYWLPVFQMVHRDNYTLSPDGDAYERRLVAIHAYHEKSLKLINSIESPSAKSPYGQWRSHSLQYFPNPSVENNFYPDFSVSASNSSGFLYYTYLPEQASYVIDSQLHSKKNLRYSQALNQLFADDTLPSSGNKMCRITYAWKSRQWLLVKDTCFIKQVVPVANPMAYPNQAILYASAPGRTFPLQIFPSDTIPFILYDTFYVSNPLAYNVSVKVPKQEYVQVDIPKSIPARQTVPVHIQYSLKPFGDPIRTYSDGVYIQFGAHQTLSYYLTAPMLAAGSTAMAMNQQRHYYRRLNEKELFFLATDTNDKLLEYGHLRSRDSLRIGRWQVYQENGQLYRDTVYNKLFRLVTQPNEARTLHGVVHYANKTSEKIESNPQGVFEFYLHGPIDSIRIEQDSLYALCCPQYNEMTDGMSMYVFWLKEAQPFYWNQYVKVPVNFNHEQYYIQWNPDRLSRQFKNQDSLDAFEYARFKEAFPDIKVEKTHDGDYYVDLFNYAPISSAQQKQQLLKGRKGVSLPNDTAVNYIDNIKKYLLDVFQIKAMLKLHRPVVNNGGLLMAAPIIAVSFPRNADLKKQNELFKQWGFNFTGAASISTPTYIYEAQRPITDEAFYGQFNKMVETLSTHRIQLEIQYRIKPVLEKYQYVKPID